MWNTRWQDERRTAARLVARTVLGLLATIAAASESPETIRVALTGDMRSSWPGVQRDSNSDDILQHVVESLVVHRGDLEIAPMAADRYEISDDLRTYRFTLRDGLLFHNLEPVRAEHLALNWRKILDPANGFQCLPFYDGTIGAKVVAVEAEDERTLKIVLDRPNAVFLDMLANVQCPVAVLHPDSWDETGRWRHPIGTGPFSLARWEKGRFVLLEKFEQYRPRAEPASGLAGGKHACVDRIRWLSITDLIAANAAVVSGQVDLNYAVAPVSALELERNDGVEVLKHPGAGRQVILIRRSGPLVGDLRIRRAIAHALDLELLADTATLGMADANPSVVPEGSRAYSDAHGQWLPHDRGKAADLLEEAGYDGRPLVIRTTRSAQLLFDAAMISQAMLREAGLNVRVEVMEWSALVAAYFEGDYALMTFEYSPRLTPFLGYLAVVGTGNRSTYLWNDQIASNLLMSASQEPVLERRYRLYEKIHRRMIDQVPAINLFDIPIIDVVSEHMSGYSTWIGGTPRLWNVCLSSPVG